MSGVLSPIGPEEPRVYWLRRGVVAAVIVALTVIIVTAVNAIGGGQTAGPTPPAAGSTPQLRPDEPGPQSHREDASGGEPSATPRATPPSAIPPSANPPSANPPSATGAEPSSPAPTPPAATSPPATSPTSSSPASSSAASSPAASSPAASDPSAERACDRGALRVSLDGPSRIRAGDPVTFTVAVTNTGRTTCRLVLDADNVEVRIHSGTDRIWTTDRCARWITPVRTSLEPGAAATWRQGWRVNRNRGCADRPERLRPGTYAANVEVDGVRPAQVVMQLR